MTPTLSDAAMLLRAICARPDDDAPRLAYADAIEERGEADTARFIRSQIKLANGELKCKRTGRPCGQCRACKEESWTGVYVLHLAPKGWHGSARDQPNELTRSRFFYYHRGFPALVALPVAALCGGECTACHLVDGTIGPQRLVWDLASSCWIACPACYGTGRTGIAAQLARLPLTRVRVTDREPDGGWWWRDGDGAYADHPAYVPSKLFNLFDSPHVEAKNGLHFPSADLAIDALNLAALALVRGLNPEAV